MLHPMRAIVRLLPLACALGTLLPQAIGAQRSTTIPPLYPAPVSDAPDVAPDTVGLRFRVGPGTGRAAERPNVAPALLLSGGDAERILARLPALQPRPTAADSFAFPARTLPPPRAGRVTLAAFPAPDTAPLPRPGPRAPAPLAVVRGAPQGEVEIGAEVTVTFSQPMVPLSSVSEVEGRALPVRLSPQPAGSWRWLDVRTLVFTPRGRMPAATEYTVTVPAGTRAETGGVLGEAVSWTFRTPALTAVGGSPQGGSVRRQPVIVIQFDQRIDRAAVLSRIALRSGTRTFPLRAATAAEIGGDPTAKALARRGDSIPWIAFRPVEPLPANTEVEVVVPAGTPSAEGPIATATAQSWRFRTYGPLRVMEGHCSYGRDVPCRPGTPFTIRFSNSLDTAAFEPSWVAVQPAIPGMTVVRQGSIIAVVGRTQPNTRYSVTVSPRVRDEFGQTLGAVYTTAFQVGAPFPELAGFADRMVVLDPAGPRRVSVLSHDHARLRVRIHRVQPRDWPSFRPNRPQSGAPAPLPGTEVVNRIVRIAAGVGEMSETAIDLDEVLRGGPGQLVVAVEGMDGEGMEQGTYAWVQATRIGLAAMVDPGEVTAWATSLVDGAPLPGAQVTVERGSREAATGADGTATLPLPPPDLQAGWISARLGDDVALLPGGWQRRAPGVEILWYGITDRNLYRPGEEVKFKGWARLLERAPEGGIGLPARAARAVAWRVRDPRGNELAAGRAELTALGGFDGGFRVPEGANLGYGFIELRLEEAGTTEVWSGSIGFQVQEFRRPEYEVTAEADEGPHVVGGSAEMSVRAAYFSGGALPGAPVTWELRSEPAFFTPPGWGEWRFGVMDGGYYYGGGRPAETFRRRFEGTTDAQGRHAVRVHFDAAEPPRAHTLVGEATVLDVNRQPWSTTTRMLVHPAEVYAGMRTERAWLQAGQPIELSVIAVDLEGRTVEGRPVEVTAVRMDWRQDGRMGWSEVETADSARCAVVSGPNPVPCTFATGELGGRWRISALVQDARGRPSLTRFDVWVYGGGAWMRGPGEDARNAARRVTLVPDRERYAPGDTARVLVQLPFWPARGILSIRREGLVRTQEIASDGPTVAVDIPVGEDDVPNLNVQVDVVGAYDREGRRRPTARGTDYATGAVSLAVPPGPRTLQVTPTPADSVLTPDAQTSVEVLVRDAAGRPVRDAEVVVVVVDEAVLALTGYRLANPIDLFYPGWNPGVQDAGIRPWVLLADTTGPGQVRGVVVNAQTRQPVTGAVVTVEGTALRALTDAGGRFRLSGLPVGSHTVRVTAPGLATAEQTVQVGQDPVPELRFELGAGDLTQLAVLQRQRAGRGNEVSEEAMAAPTLAAPPAPPPEADFVGQGKVGGVASAAPISVRANFAALALWAPVVRTDADGRARVPFTLPSNLTRYRVMAAAVQDGTLYGAGESSLTARQPLMVRPSAPRFLNYGDRFELPVVVQNTTDQAIDVEVAARGEGVRFTEPGKRVRVPAGDRVEVRIAAEAVRPGTATLQIAAVAGALSDAATITLPVYTPATAEAFATYGSIGGDSVVELPLRVPDDAIPAFGGLEVTTSSTALQELTDAFIYLVRYPYECAEQIASRLLAVAALRDVLTEFRAEGMPDPAVLADSVARDLVALQSMQTSDGGFAFWPGRDESWPYVSLHVTHALLRAREKGYPVNGEMLERAMEYVRRIDQHAARQDYPPSVRLALRAYGGYVLDLAHDRGADAQLRRVMEGVRLDTIPLEPVGWLLAAVAERAPFAAQRAELLRIVDNRATETASTATFVTRYDEGEYLLLHSARRTDGVVLEALLRADPRNELITKTVRGLLGHRVRGRWDNTQENAWVLLALDRYFRVYEGQTPEFVARVWLGDRFAGERRFVGRSADRHHLDVPMRVLVDDDPNSLAIGKEGPGRLYYRAGLRYAPRDLDVTPLERGFAIERTYEAIDDPRDVVRGDDGRWRVRAGARVRITLTMTAPSRRVHVAMVDPLPAGFEAVNTALLGAQDTPPEGERVRPAGRTRGGEYYYWWRSWYEHQNLRDDRVEAFTSLLPAGVYTYSYVARATTPGLFIVPPPRVEEMYSPETFGRGGTERVMVVAEEPGNRE
jgi:alpha-2-macroglobulin